MNPKDKVISEFFQKMKENDKRLIIPVSPVLKNANEYNWLPWFVAASLLLFLVSYVMYSIDNSSEEYTISIKLESNSDSTTESLVNNTASIDTWESPTESLIEDF
jgi:hypothetical protein